jgi:hypothetical protein
VIPMVSRRCACGGTIWAVETAGMIEAAVQNHNGTPSHRRWRQNLYRWRKP